jgi:methylated-DNA-[protein]-cysteine S-methyltransferase
MFGTKAAKAFYASPIGLIQVVGTEGGLLALDFVDGERAPDSGPAPFLAECLGQLDEYFLGRRKAFSVRLDLRGTPFQSRVWNELLNIPFGRTATYRSIAEALGNARATRAVGGANHRNPISIIVPCHRVLGVRGSLTGYGGGLWRKEWLLAHERQHL